MVARELKKDDESEIAIQRALQIAQRSFPNSHVYPRTLETLAILRKFDNAENEIRRVTVAMDKIDGISDFEKSDYIATLASALDGLGRTYESEGAEELLERARKQAETE